MEAKQGLPLHIFCCYAREDERWRNHVYKHFLHFMRRNILAFSDELLIMAGENKEDRYSELFQAADILLLLMSPNFLASPTCYEHMQRAFGMQREHLAHVLVLQLSPVHWPSETLPASHIFPESRKPIALWRNKDAGLIGLAARVEELATGSQAALQAVHDGEHGHASVTRRDYYGDSALPPFYIRRETLLTEVKEALLASPPSTASVRQEGRTTALYGLGGVGKTVIAHALFEDHDLQNAFPGGTLWATLGPQPDLLSSLRAWVTTLGGTIREHAPTADMLRSRLIQLLRDRACLLILDDVCEQEHAEVFRVGGPQCHLLLTTRDAEIGYSLGATIQSTPFMSEGEAIQLLEAWTYGNLDHVAAELKTQIVKRLGLLPLAIKLAAAQLRQEPAEEWLDRFHLGRLKAKRVSPHDRQASLEHVFEQSLQALEHDFAGGRSLFASLAIFREDETIPLRAIEHLWQSLDVDVDTRTELFADLQARALLEKMADQSSVSFRIHDLLREFIVSELGNESAQRHRTLLQNYRMTREGNGWHTAPDDGYLYNHLAYHLRGAGANRELGELFASDHWLHVRVAQREYTYDGYLEDLDGVWHTAEMECREQLQVGQEPSAFIACSRYLLIWSSITSLATTYVPEIIAQAVRKGVWTPHRSLRIAARSSDGEQRAAMYQCLLETPQLDVAQRMEAIKEGWNAALSLSSTSWNWSVRSQFLAALASRLSMEQLEQLDTSQLSRHERGFLLFPLAAQAELEGEEVELLWDAALHKLIDKEQEQTLMALAPRLEEKQVERILGAALLLSDEARQAQALNALAVRLEGAQAERAWQATLEISDEYRWKRQQTLIALALQLGKEQVERALRVALRLLDKERRWQVLVALAPRLKGKQIEQAWDAALDLRGGQGQEQALQALVPHVEHERIMQLWDITLNIHDQKLREGHGQLLAILLSQIAPPLAERQSERALSIALRLPNNGERWELIEALAPHLEGEQVERAWKSIFPLFDSKLQEPALASLIPRFEYEQIERMLNSALRLPNKEERMEIVAALAPGLKGIQVERAWNEMLSLSRKVIVTRQQGYVAAVALRLEGEQLDRALDTVLRLGNDPLQKRTQKDLLAMWAPCLKREQIELVLNESLRLPRLWQPEDTSEGERIEQILDTILRISNKRERWQALASLMVRLERGQVEQLYNAAIRLPGPEQRTEVLAALVPYLEGQHVDQVLDATMLLTKEEKCGHVLLALIPQLETGQMEQMLRAALNLSNRRMQILVFIALLPWIEDEQIEHLLDAALREVDAEVLSVVVPRLEKEQVDQALRVILLLPDGLQRERMFIALAPRLEGEQVEQALDAALSLPSEWERGQVLVALLPQLAPDQIEQQLHAALQMPVAERRTEYLAALAPRLEGEQVEQALDAVFRLSSSWQQSQVLAALAPRLEGEQVEQAWGLALRSAPECQREQTFAALAPRLEKEQIQAVLDLSLYSEAQEEQVQIVAALASRLERGQIAQVLPTVLALPNEGQRGQVLLALAPHLEAGEQIERVFRAALHLSNERVRGQVLLALAPHLETGEQIEQTLKATSHALDSWGQAQLCMALAPRLEKEQVEQIVNTIIRLSDEQEREQVTTALVTCLQGEQVEYAWNAALHLRDKWQRAHIMAIVALRLQGEQTEQAWNAALSLRDTWQREQAFMALAPSLEKDRIERVLNATLHLSNAEKRRQALAALAGQLEEEGHIKQVLRVALLVEDAWQNEQVVVALFSHSSKKDGVKGTTKMLHIRSALLDLLYEARMLERQKIAEIFAARTIFSPRLFSQEMLSALSSSMVEISEQWQWL